MKKHSLLYQMLLTVPLASLAIISAHAETQQFVPAKEPVFSTPRAKPNIHMVLDDSGSMKNNQDVPGSVADGDGLDQNGNVVNIRRTTALDRTVTKILNKYRDKAYLGVSFLWQGSQNNGLIHIPLEDYSKYSVTDFQTKIIAPTSTKILASPGSTPVSRGVYEAIKMFRGQPVNEGTSRNVNTDTKGRGDNRYYAYTEQLKNPVRYRCQQNHMVVMTDGEPNDNTVYGVAKEDSALHSSATKIASRVNEKLVNGVDMSVRHTSVSSAHLGQITANFDLRNYVKKTKAKDDAGQDWFEPKYSKPMPLYMHTVSLFVDPKAEVYTGLTRYVNKGNNKETAGMNLGFAKGQGTVDDLLLAFDTIFASIILSTSSMHSMNDRFYADLMDSPPKLKSDGSVDLTTVGTIRYDSVYDFRQRFGSLRATVPYLHYPNPNNKDKETAEIKYYEIWNTDTSITPTQGRYVTFLKQDGRDPGLTLAELNDPAVLARFRQIRPGFSANDIEWLTNFRKTANLGDLRARANPLGSLTNSEVLAVNKDVLNISITKEKMSSDLRKELSNWLLYKAKFQPNNLLIVSDNDGFVSFIKAQRGLSKGHKGGERDTAYFPQMLVHRFDEIAKSLRTETLVMDGKTDVVDANVYQPSGNGGEDIYATIGLTSMGGGGKGLVGYRIYAARETAVNDWISDSQKGKPTGSGVYEKITPLFEITNEGPNRTEGFENLGYTYSGFEFFNRMVTTADGKERGQAVAVFGNGFGGDKSTLFFVDAYTGEKLHEIVLDPKGKGASTPSIVVTNDGAGQKLNRIYVGDYSGTLYKVQFNGEDFDSDSATVTALFKAPETNFGQSAIAVKPLVVKNPKTELYQVFFGTGLAASMELDRYDNSLVTHALYGITDGLNKAIGDSQKSVTESNKTVPPLFTVNNLKEGRVKYREGETPNYEELDEHALTTINPVENPNESSPNGNDNGWYIILSADNDDKGKVGEKGSGERVIINPKYDSVNKAVVFSTWGIKERGSKVDPTALDDPCMSDLAFGKILSFYAATGGGSYDISLANKGKTGAAIGGLTGDGIEDAPEGNELTTLEDLVAIDESLADTLLTIVDAENSSYETDERNSSVHCYTRSDGVQECKIVKEGDKPKGKAPVRLSLHGLYSF